jgi:hypothetical protein
MEEAGSECGSKSISYVNKSEYYDLLKISLIQNSIGYRNLAKVWQH